MRQSLLVSLILLVPLRLSGQAPLTRTVSGRTLTSPAHPAATFVVDSAFRFVGAQAIDVVKVAGAEQYFFIQAAPDRSIRRFYWFQFEQYYPTNSYTYDFSEMRQQPVPLGPLSFMGDVRTSPNYFTMDDRPGSDSKAAETFLRGHGLILDGTFVTLRLFHLPDSTRRRELMIIYGEVLPPGTPETDLTAAIVRRAQAGVTVH